MFEIHLNKIKYKFPAIFFILFLFAVASTAFAQVKINEIAWMGTKDSASNEWIELYNPDSSPVDLTDWTLSWNTTVVGMKKTTIGAFGYYLLERTDDTTVADVPADLIYTGGLRDSGEILTLKNSGGVEVDRVDGSSSWKINGGVAVGKTSTRETAQLTPSGWITATGTPGAANATFVTVAQSSTSSPEVDKPITISTHESPIEISEKVPASKFLVGAGRDRLTTVGAEVVFDAKLTNEKGEAVDASNVSWSFGDGMQTIGKRVKHVYKFPGTYAVILNVSNNSEDFVSRASVTAVSPELEVFCDYSFGTFCPIEVKNFSGYELNLGGWIIEGERSTFTFPKDTIVLPKKTILLSKDLTGIIPAPENNIVLKSPSGEIVFKLKFLNLPVYLEVEPPSKSIPTIISTSTMLEQLSAAEKILNTIVEKNRPTPAPSFMGSLARANLAVAVIPPAPLEAPEDGVVSLKTIEVIDQPKSFIGTIVHLPVSAFNYIKNLFF